MNELQKLWAERDARAKATIARLEQKLTAMGIAKRIAVPTYLDTCFRVKGAERDRGAWLQLVSPSIDKLDTIEAELIASGEMLGERYQFKNGLKSITVNVLIEH